MMPRNEVRALKTSEWIAHENGTIGQVQRIEGSHGATTVVVTTRQGEQRWHWMDVRGRTHAPWPQSFTANESGEGAEDLT